MRVESPLPPRRERRYVDTARNERGGATSEKSRNSRERSSERASECQERKRHVRKHAAIVVACDGSTVAECADRSNIAGATACEVKLRVNGQFPREKKNKERHTGRAQRAIVREALSYGAQCEISTAICNPPQDWGISPIKIKAEANVFSRFMDKCIFTVFRVL